MVNWTSLEGEKPFVLENVPAGTVVQGDLDLSDSPLRTLPEDLTITGRLTLNDCRSLYELPRGLRCYELAAQRTPLRTIPEDIQVTSILDLSQCEQLEELPQGLKVGMLIVLGCASLRALPEASDIYFLDMTRCTRIT